MQRKILSFVIAAFMLCLTACSDGETIISDNSTIESSVETSDGGREDGMGDSTEQTATEGENTESDSISKETEEETGVDTSSTEQDKTVEGPAEQPADITLPAEGEGGSIIAAGERIAAPEGTECIALSEEPNVEFLFSSGVALRNLQFVSLSFDGASYKREEFLHTCIDFAQGEMIKVSCYLPETYSNLLLQYEDPTGEFFSYFVIYDMSGDNMAVALKDAMTTEIKW